MIEIITIGDELLIGQIVDTNSGWMASELNKAGFEISQLTSVHDTKEDIQEVLTQALEKSKVVLLSGGLGPTNDDITKKTLAEFFDTDLVFDDSVLQNIEKLFSTRSLSVNELTRQQAMVPAACEVIQNRVGTAPILWFEHEGKVVVSMPGVPFEMKRAMSESIIPRLKQQFGGRSVLNKTVQVSGYGESWLAMKIEEWERALPSFLTLAYLPSLGVVKLRLSGVHNNGKELELEIDRQFDRLDEILGSAVFAKNDLKVEENLGIMLRDAKLTIATAESCTGGNIARRIVSVPGSSEYYLGSVTAYQDNVKRNLLQVGSSVIEEHGAVSEPVVIQMAKGLKELVNSDISIAVSGIAGPGGGTEEKPVGYVWIAVAYREKTYSKLFKFGNYPRKVLIERFTIAAMLMVFDVIRENSISN